MQALSVVQTITIWIIPVLFAITLHEAAHGWLANQLGDDTAKLLGRVTFNPFKHIDLVGTILVPILVAVLSQFQFVFGWAKPVPVNWNNLHNPRRDMALVAAIGPVSNMMMALMWAPCMKLGLLLHPQNSSIAQFMVLSGQAGVLINLILAVFNLLIIPPLDGSRILASLLPPPLAFKLLAFDNAGYILLLLLMVTGILGQLIFPPIVLGLKTIFYLFNIIP